MAERKDLTIRVKADTKGLRQIRDESEKASRAVRDTGRRTISTFSQLDKQLQNVAISVAKIGTVVGAAFAIGGIGLFTKALFDAGVEAERAETRIAALFQTSREQAREAFQAIEQFAAPLPVTTQEIVQGFIQLSAINLDATEENLRALTSAALATTRSVDDLANVVASMEVEPLRKLGIQLKRTGETAVISFGPNIRNEVANTDKAIREGLLQTFAEAFPNAIEEAQDTYEASMAVIGSVTQSFLTTGGIALKDSIKDIAQEIAAWLEENEKLLRQGITLFARDLATGIALTVDVTKALIQGMGGLQSSMRPVKAIFLTFTELLIDATDAAIALNQGLINIQRFALNINKSIDVAPEAFGPLGPLIKGVKQLIGTGGISTVENDLADLEQRNAQLIETANQLDAALRNAKDSFDQNAESVAGMEFEASTLNEVLAIMQQAMGGTTESTEELDDAVKDLNDSLEKQIEDLQLQVATYGKSDEEIVKIQASLLRTKGASAELVEEFKDLSLELIGLEKAAEKAQEIERVNESLESELEKLTQEILTFGKSAKEVAIIEELMLLNAGASKELAAQLTDAKIQLAELNNEAERLEKLQDDLESVTEFITPESDRLRQELERRLQVISDALDEEKLTVQEAQRIKAEIYERSEKEITDAIRAEQIERLKSTGEFTDAVKASLLEFQDAARDTSDILTEFFSDTFNEIRNIFASFIDDILAGKIDDLKDLWKSALASMRQIFSQFVAAIATNAIRIQLAPSIQGGGAGGLFNQIGGLFGLGGGGVSLGAQNNIITGNTGPFGLGGFPGGGQGGGGFFSQIGKFLPFAAPFLGAGLGFLSGGTQGAISGGITGLGAGGGFLLGGPVGGVIGGILGGFLGDLIGGFFEDRPRLDIEVFGIGNVQEIQEGIGRTVNDIIRLGIDEAFRRENIFVKGKGGAEDLEEADAIRELIANTLNNTVDQIFGIINQLPADLASTLRETFVNTELTFRQLVDDVSLEFDEGSSDIEDVKKRFEQFIQGDLQARFLDTIDSFFVAAFQGLGVTADRAQAFVDERLGEIRTTESRERRGELGREFLQDFQTFVNAFNIVSGNFGDSANLALNQVRTLSEELGFDFIPTLDEITAVLDEGLDTLNIDPETVDKLIQLRQSIIDLTVSVSQSVVSISGTIQQLNSDIVALGGTSQSSAGAIRQAIENIKGLLQNESLGVDERQGLLLQLNQLADALFQATTNAAQDSAEQQRQNIETRIEGLREERTVIQEVFQARIDALNEELRIAEGFAQLTDNIKNDIRSILLSQNSVLTPIEQVSFLQSEITDLQRSLNLAGTDEERLDIAGQLRESLLDLFSTGENAFQPGSPEFFALFSEVTGELENLQDVTANSSRSVEEINAEIESLTAQNNQQLQSIDAQIERLQNINITTGTQTNAEVRELKEFVREELFGILDTRTELLDSLQLQQENISVLEQIRDILASPDKGSGGGRLPVDELGQPISGPARPTGPVPVEITNTDDTQPDNPVFNPFAFTQPAATGFDQIVRRPTLFMTGEAGPEHVQVTPGGERKEVNVNINMNFTGRNGEQMNIKLLEDSVRTGRLGAVIEERVKKAIN